MTVQSKRWGLGLLTAFLLSGCVSTDSLQPGDIGGATLSIRGRSYEQIWKAATQAMSTDMKIVESHKPSGVIKSRVGSTPTGKVVAIFIQPTTPASEYTVRIVSKKPLQTDFVDRDWEPSVVEDLKAALNLR